MFHILGDCYLQKKPDILVLRPSSQNGEKLQFINYFLFRMEINSRHTSWLHVTCLGAASRTASLEYFILLCCRWQGQEFLCMVLLIYGNTSPFLVNVAKFWWLDSKLRDAHFLSAEVMFRLTRGLEGISSPALEIPRRDPEHCCCSRPLPWLQARAEIS